MDLWEQWKGQALALGVANPLTAARLCCRSTIRVETQRPGVRVLRCAVGYVDITIRLQLLLRRRLKASRPNSYE